ncbi:MAG: MXAN_6577-like cysteine-rich protein [Polyangiales bacterium]
MTPRALVPLLLFALAACSRGQTDADAKAPPDDLAVAPDGDDSDGPLVNRPDAEPKGFDVSVVDDVDLLDRPSSPDASPDATSADATSPPPDEPVVMPTCGAGEVPCGARCVVIDSNPLHCGRCGNACAADQECLVGTCSPRCPAGTSRCGLPCVDLSIDAANCGACGRACPAGMRCTAGACELACAAGQLACGGRCVDPATDVANCGACGRACPASQRCRAGACVPTGPGAPCGSNADCDPTAPTCFPQAIGWQGGYCTRQCTRDDCPAGSLCISDGSANFCLRTCTAASGCRAGYLCRSVGGTDSVCYPSCTANPYALCGAATCNAATGICRFVCASNGDCTAGSTCNTASPRRCTCSASTDCGPGRTCLTRYGYCGCNSDAACGPDALCDPTYGICRAR